MPATAPSSFRYPLTAEGALLLATVPAPAARPTIAQRMQALIDSFPTLQRRGMRWIGADRRDVGSACFTAQCRGLSSGEHHAATFILHVWNWREAPKGMRFDFGAAVNAWDDEHVAAVREWMRAPWYA